MRDHLSYYKKINSIPTVDVNDLNKKLLFKQRFNFYFKNGITKGELKNKSVIELCPGTGYNAYYLLKKCKIKKIKLVEKNLSSLKKLKKNLSSFSNAKIINRDIFNFNTNEKFDFVIIENAIDGFSKPEKIFKKLCKFVKSDGTIILTFADKYGLLSTKLRYLYAIMLMEQNNIKDFSHRVKFLTKVFKSHLYYLSKNSRKANKWTIDNILNIEWIIKKNYFDYLSLKKLVNNNFLIRSISPSFVKNFIWYKNLNNKKHNLNIFNNYNKESINFLDFETQFTTYSKKLSHHVKKIIAETSKFNPDKKINSKNFNVIFTNILKINKILKKAKPKNKISLALNEFIKLMSKFKKNKKVNLKTKYFYKFWGIGTQHINLYKTAD